MEKTNAAPLLWQLDLASIEGKLILVELELLEEILPSLQGRALIVFSNLPDEFGDCFVRAEGISKIVLSIQRTCKEFSKDERININFLIHGIDMMDLNLDNRRRGSLRKGMLSMLPSRILKGANVIVTSSQEEYMLRELCDRHINLRTEQKK